MTRRCEYPAFAEGEGDVLADCGRPSVWTTDDLGDVHHLCNAHCVEAMTSNDFSFSPVEAP